VLARQLHEQGRLTGVLGLGGSAGTTLATAPMRGVPVGPPQGMVRTMAAGQVRPRRCVPGHLVRYSGVGLRGLNRVSRTVLTNAAHAMIGMTRRSKSQEPGTTEYKPLVTATMFGVTTPCVESGRTILEKAGYEVLVFHATGTGGQTMEA